MPEKLNSLNLGMSKTEVITLLGATTFYSLFEENIMIYAYEVYTKRLSFSSKIISDSKVLVLSFDNNNKLNHISIYDLSKRNNIPLLKQSTKDILKKQKIKKINKDYDLFAID